MALGRTGTVPHVQPLVIVGAGGHGREALDIVEALNDQQARYEVRGFVASSGDEALLERRGARLLGDVDLLADLDVGYVLAIGMPWDRRSVGDRIDGYGRDEVSLVHPAATVGGDNRLGPGAIVAAGARITTNVVTGRHTHLNVAAVVSHDCVLGDYVTISPGGLVNGNVTLEDEVFLGTGAIVTPGVRVGARARIGAGAVVVDDVPPDVTARGVPARW
jgi:sugar O-acyltransferase (sialic acid O-acetyltransferase NeuD family)